MKTKYLVWIAAILLVFSLAACDLPEMTPPAADVVPSSTPAVQVPPAITPTQAPSAVSLVKIKENNVQKLALAHKAAVSNASQITWSNDGKSLSVITQNSDANGNQVFGVTSLNSSDLSPRAVFSSPGDRISSIAPDGRTVAVISQDMNTFKLIDMSNNNQMIYSSTPGYLVGNITFSPDLRYYAVQKMESWEVVLFSLAANTEVKTLSGFETASPVFNAGFVESSQWIVWHARATLQLQEVESGAMDGTFSHQDIGIVYAMSPDGTLLASSAANAIHLWDTTTGAEIKSFEIATYANSLSFSPDGKLLAVAAGSAVQIWDPAAGTLLTTLTGHTDQVIKVAFSPDQNSLATAGLDNQLYLWQISE